MESLCNTIVPYRLWYLFALFKQLSLFRMLRSYKKLPLNKNNSVYDRTKNARAHEILKGIMYVGIRSNSSRLRF